jgi:NADH-quinone oxidoreductase subunit J
MNFFFFLLSFLLILSALFIILSKNPIHSILYLILVFVCSSGLLLLLGAEFLSMIFLIIYVGAISVLFIFVIMMLNIRMIELRENLIKYVPLTFIISFILLFELFYLFNNLHSDFFLTKNSVLLNYFDINYFHVSNFTNLQLLGYYLYTYFIDYFIICGVILFIAMIGAIVLTLHLEFSIKKQDLFLQIGRNFNKTIKNIKI